MCYFTLHFSIVQKEIIPCLFDYVHPDRPADIPEILWFEEENELIRSCGVLSSALGLRKSFSTSDVSQLPSPDAAGAGSLRTAVSALALDTVQRNTLLLESARLDHASRSCSTWVAVGEPVASTSQLPSPHGGAAQEQQQQQLSQPQQAQQQSSSNAQSVSQLPPQPPAPPPPPVPFTGADLVRSVNKKVRQNYIRRRLVTDNIVSSPFIMLKICRSFYFYFLEIKCLDMRAFYQVRKIKIY